MANYKDLNHKQGVHNIIAPVGLAWLRSQQVRPDIPLYLQIDNRHPTRRGSILYALTVYVSIYRNNPVQTVFFNDISEVDTRFLCNTAYYAVMDTITYTNMRAYSLNINRIGDILIADSKYHNYRWFKNGVEINDKKGFIIRMDHSNTYSVKAISKNGCTIESPVFKF